MEFDYPQKYFNYILLPDVLEHLKDPWGFLEKIRDYLDDDGSILSSIPNIMHISVIRELFCGVWQYKDAGILDKTHLRFFTLSEIVKMFALNKYKVIKISSNRLSLSEDENLLISNLENSCNIDKNIIEQMKNYQYILEAKKQL